MHIKPIVSEQIKHGKIYAEGKWPEIAAQEFNYRNYYFYEPISKKVRQYKNSKKRPINIINIGSGNGDILETLEIDQEDSYLGVDLCPVNTKFAQLYYESENITSKVGNGQKFNTSQQFDVYISTMAWHHFTDLKEASQTAHSLLKNEGILELITPNFIFLNSWISGYQNLKLDKSKNRYLGDYILPCGLKLKNHDFNAHTVDTLLRELSNAGFKNIKLKMFSSDNPLKTNNHHEFLAISADK